MRLSHKLSLSLLTLCVSQQLYAETMSMTNDDAALPLTILDPIIVTAEAKTGTALGQKISEMPAVTQVIYQDEITEQATGNRTVGDILAQTVPSLGLSSGSTSNYATTMRGRPVQFLLNGVPLTGSRNLSRQLNSIDPTQLERIEVLSGATSIYGAGATGGLINLVTKSAGANEGLHGETRVGVNSHRNFESESIGYNVGQSMDYTGATFFGRLDVDYETKGGSFDSHDQRISPDVNQTDQQDTKTLSVNANLGVNLTDMQNINLAATYYNNEQDTEFGPDYGKGLSVLLVKGTKPSLKAIEGAQVANQPFTEKNSVSLNYHNEDVLGSNLNITGYYRDEKGRFYPSGKAFTSETKDVLIAAGITDPATLKKLLRGTITVAQSEADIEVMGIRAAMQTESNLAGKKALFSYGVDYETEQDKQTYYEQDINKFIASNGLVAEPNGNALFGGPDTTVDKLGAFINADVDLTDKLHASAGVRYQNIQADTDAFIPLKEQLIENYFALLRQNNIPLPYTAGTVAAGKTDHSKTLFNLGASYQVDPSNQVFANFSQGFTIADIQRALRDVPAGFVVNSDNVEPITVNNYELGWQGNFKDTKARLSGFYNTSDKVVRFTPDYMVEVADTDERVYGAEASIRRNLSDRWTLGSTLAYTSGQYKADNGDWKALDATRITPLKGTAFAQYNFLDGSHMRLQVLAVDGTDKAHKEDPTSSMPVTGYATLDLLGQVKLPKGHLNYGIYNLLNKDYRSVYHQTTYGDLNRLNAKGTSYGLSYTIKY